MPKPSEAYVRDDAADAVAYIHEHFIAVEHCFEPRSNIELDFAKCLYGKFLDAKQNTYNIWGDYYCSIIICEFSQRYFFKYYKPDVNHAETKVLEIHK